MKQFVTIKGECSDEQDQNSDISHGMDLGPSLYEDYAAAPIGSIFWKHDISLHVYVDDTQAYVPFCIADEQESLERLEVSLGEVKR